jgi:ferredoxin-NADP reductase
MGNDGTDATFLFDNHPTDAAPHGCLAVGCGCTPLGSFLRGVLASTRTSLGPGQRPLTA